MTDIDDDPAAVAQRTLNFLASMPEGVTTVTRKVVRAIMLATDGQMMVAGHLREVKATPLAGGVYRVRLEKWKP